MIKYKVFVFFSLLFGYNSLIAQQLAFPSAEGFGRFARGGRGGTVYHVTNLNDAGPGSFRDAISVSNRTVVFDVSGVIITKSLLNPKSNIYIAGQTAPGDGIVMYGDRISFSASHNTICRYMRFRYDRSLAGTNDCAGLANGQNLIFDNCSFSWGEDGTFDANGFTTISNLTLQDCIIGQGLQDHSTGGLMETAGTSVIRSLYIDNNTRNPKVKGLNQFVNSVVYNWGSDAYILGDTDSRSDATLVNNYFISGPNTSAGASGDPFSRATNAFHLHATGNYFDGDKDGLLDGAIVPQANYGPVTWETSPSATFPAVAVRSAKDAVAYIIQNAGASLKRDQVDKYVIDELASYGKRGAIIKLPAGMGLANVVGTIANGTAPLDTDKDGMSDTWETARGLNKNVADNNGDRNNDGYTNLEEYLSCLVGDIPNCSTVTALDEEMDSEMEQPALAYPNPFNNESVIQAEGEFVYSIYDVSGIEIENGIGGNTKNVGTFLKAGVYMIKIQTSAGSKYLKVVKE